MALTLEWGHRIDRWREELARHFYHPLGTVALSGFVTRDQLTAEEALRGDFAPMPPGTEWGGKWEYGWFKGQVVLPDAAAGTRVVLAVDVGAESAVFVDGDLAGAQDRFHHHITLAARGVPGTRYDVLIEAYAGHGPRVCHAGPTPPGRETVPPARPHAGHGRHEHIWRVAGGRLPALGGRRDPLPDSRERRSRFAARGRDRPGAAGFYRHRGL